MIDSKERAYIKMKKLRNSKFKYERRNSIINEHEILVDSLRNNNFRYDYPIA